MASIDTLATFFGWCSVINVGFLVALALRGIVVRKVAAKLFGVTVEEVKTAYMNAVIQYRTATLVLSVTPYIALKIMTW